MVSFEFAVGISVLKHASRPITIPKKLYGQLERDELVSSGHVTVFCPDGTGMTGYIHQLVAGFGPYYQLRVRDGLPGDPISRLRVGDRLLVEIGEYERKVHVKLSLIQ